MASLPQTPPGASSLLHSPSTTHTPSMATCPEPPVDVDLEHQQDEQLLQALLLDESRGPVEATSPPSSPSAPAAPAAPAAPSTPSTPSAPSSQPAHQPCPVETEADSLSHVKPEPSSDPGPASENSTDARDTMADPAAVPGDAYMEESDYSENDSEDEELLRNFTVQYRTDRPREPAPETDDVNAEEGGHPSQDRQSQDDHDIQDQDSPLKRDPDPADEGQSAQPPPAVTEPAETQQQDLKRDRDGDDDDDGESAQGDGDRPPKRSRLVSGAPHTSHSTRASTVEVKQEPDEDNSEYVLSSRAAVPPSSAVYDDVGPRDFAMKIELHDRRAEGSGGSSSGGSAGASSAQEGSDLLAGPSSAPASRLRRRRAQPRPPMPTQPRPTVVSSGLSERMELLRRQAESQQEPLQYLQTPEPPQAHPPLPSLDEPLPSLENQPSPEPVETVETVEAHDMHDTQPQLTQLTHPDTDPCGLEPLQLQPPLQTLQPPPFTPAVAMEAVAAASYPHGQFSPHSPLGYPPLYAPGPLPQPVHGLPSPAMHAYFPAGGLYSPQSPVAYSLAHLNMHQPSQSRQSRPAQSQSAHRSRLSPRASWTPQVSPRSQTHTPHSALSQSVQPAQPAQPVLMAQSPQSTMSALTTLSALPSLPQSALSPPARRPPAPSPRPSGQTLTHSASPILARTRHPGLITNLVPVGPNPLDPASSTTPADMDSFWEAALERLLRQKREAEWQQQQQQQQQQEEQEREREREREREQQRQVHLQQLRHLQAQLSPIVTTMTSAPPLPSPAPEPFLPVQAGQPGQASQANEAESRSSPASLFVTHYSMQYTAVEAPQTHTSPLPSYDRHGSQGSYGGSRLPSLHASLAFLPSIYDPSMEISLPRYLFSLPDGSLLNAQQEHQRQLQQQQNPNAPPTHGYVQRPYKCEYTEYTEWNGGEGSSTGASALAREGAAHDMLDPRDVKRESGVDDDDDDDDIGGSSSSSSSSSSSNINRYGRNYSFHSTRDSHGNFPCPCCNRFLGWGAGSYSTAQDDYPRTEIKRERE